MIEDKKDKKEKGVVVEINREERAVLVAVIRDNQEPRQAEEFLDELEFLALTADYVTVKRFTQRMSTPNSRIYIGPGKLEEIAQFCEEIKLSARDYDPSHINRYLQGLAACFHRFYNACRIKGEAAEVVAARLKLADDAKAEFLEEDIADMFKDNNLYEHGHSHGKAVEYGQRTKRVKHQSPDRFIAQGVIVFGDDDRELADMEAKETDPDAAKKWLEENTDGDRPFGMEW